MPVEDTRKVQKHGDESSCITLPKGWIKYHNIQPKEKDIDGDSVTILANSIIIIVPPNRPDLKDKAKKLIEIDSNPELRKMLEEDISSSDNNNHSESQSSNDDKDKKGGNGK